MSSSGEIGHTRRRQNLRAALAARELDAMLVTDLRNVRYLTGFTGTNAVLLVHAGGEPGTVLATDGRYEQQAHAEVAGPEVLIDRRSRTALIARAASAPGSYGNLGFESHHLSVDAFDEITEQSAGLALHRVSGLVEGHRTVKDEAEIAALRRACVIADRALAELIAAGEVAEGRSERQIAANLNGRMVAGGASGPAFSTIVAAGAHSAIPHHRPTGAVLAAGDLVKIDFGAMVDGYHSDMTRMLVVGPPADWQRELHRLVTGAQAAGAAAAVAGTGLAETDAAAREVIERAGYGEQFVHGLGHGVGLDVHEAPQLTAAATGTLSAGMTVTVEPGVYLPGRGGVRIEDTVLVGEQDCEILTRSGKDLVAV